MCKPPLGRYLEYNSFSTLESTLIVDTKLPRSPAWVMLTHPLPTILNNCGRFIQQPTCDLPLGDDPTERCIRDIGGPGSDNALSSSFPD
jgi:hypothetical protein